MAETSHDLEGPDFEAGCEIESVDDGGMLLGHAFGEAILVARQGSELFAIGTTCTHYGGALGEGVLGDFPERTPRPHTHLLLPPRVAPPVPASGHTSPSKAGK